MKLVHVVPHIDREASGPSYSVPRLCESLAARGHDVELSCLAARGDIPGVTVDVHPQWPILERFAISPSHARALRRNAKLADIVHNHSLWSMVNIGAGWVVPQSGARLVTSPRGTLAPWALGRNRALKTLLWPLQRRVLARADLLHATSDVEYREIRALGFRNPVAVIPNGIDLPAPPTQAHVGPGRTLLFLSRLHPTKCVDRLLHAWQALQVEHPDWRLVVAGPGEAEHVREYTELAAKLALQRVDFAGPLYGDEKSRAYREADLFVLPTHSENFGMVVAEALAHGCPAVVSRGAPWPGLVAEDCGWWVDNELAVLTGALNDAMRNSPEVLAAMGERGRLWMERDYSWLAIAERMEAAYSWLLGAQPRPTCVRVD